MKKTLTFLSKRMVIRSQFLTFVLIGVGTGIVQAQNQIRYKPAEAMVIIDNLPDFDPTSPPQSQSHQLSANVTSAHGSGATKVTQLTPEQRLAGMRRIYYKAVMDDLRIESGFNNTVAGTQSALQRAFNRMIPSSPSSPRYGQIIQIHNSLVIILSR